MYRQLLMAFLPLAALIAIPLLLQPKAEDRTQAVKAGADKVVIITPHSESLRYEFSRAFRKYYNEKYGREVSVEWRTPGGTSDIVKYIDDRYEAAFRTVWQSNPANGGWSEIVAANFDNPKAVAGSGMPEDALNARKKFLDSDTGIGIDLFFGGGQYDHQRQAAKGYSVDAGIQQKHPEWFDDKVIPYRFSGEIFYDKQGKYYGVCLAAFGICWNNQRLAEMTDKKAPAKWADLGEPRFFQKIAVADPTKSGSVNKCFEMLIQQQMSEASGKDPRSGLSTGWADGVNLIKRIAANTRYVTDSASKVAHDVAGGNAAAGICIDFYGRSEAEWAAVQSGGTERMTFMTPENGTSVSADPIQLLRGAPNRKPAADFIEFALSIDGQKVWDFRKDTPGGPEKYVLRRMPIRKDMYQPEFTRYMADANADPYQTCKGFEYRPAWTGPYFGLIRILIKCVALDPMPELQEAWQAIIRAGGPQAVPEAMKAFNELPFDYAEIAKAKDDLNPDKPGNSVRSVLQTQRRWSELCRNNYLKAAKLARAGK